MWLHIRSQGLDLRTQEIDGQVVVGRGSTCDLVLADERASRRHAIFRVDGEGEWSVEDLGSTNGTWIDGVRISQPTSLSTGTVVRIGRHELTLAPNADPPSEHLPSDSTLLPKMPVELPVRPPSDDVVVDNPQEASPQVSGSHFSKGLSPVAAKDQTTPPGEADGPAPPEGSTPDAPSAEVSGAEAGTEKAEGPAGPVVPPEAEKPVAPSTVGDPQEESEEGGRGRHLLGAGVAALAIILVVLIILIVTDPFGSGGRAVGRPQYHGPAPRWTGTVLPLTVDTHGAPVAHGSAFVVNAAEGLVVTTAHLIDQGSVYTAGAGAASQQARVVAVSPCDDLAVLRLSRTEGLKAFPLGNQSTVGTGSNVAALVIDGPKVSAATGRVLTSGDPMKTIYVDLPQYQNVIETSAKTGASTTGGPLIDPQGRVVGILTGGTRTISGSNDPSNGMAIGISAAAPVIAQLERGVSFGYVGFNFAYPETAAEFENYGLPYIKGSLVIPSAVGDSTAYQANFGHDLAEAVTAVNGQKLNGTLGSYCSAVGQGTKGQSVVFTVIQPSKDQEKVSVPFE